ncbi:MAG: glycosyltransferase family 39 protein [Chthoniobacteraceae bacterium]|jgi:hypothetical protein
MDSIPSPRDCLPAPGFERKAFLWLVALVLVLKVMAIIHYRVDSDETQHAHVVWAWTQGQLPYRDLFDNHMPLFQMACAPFFSLLGEHDYIIIELRIAMIPLFLFCLWCVFALTERLYSRRAAPWAALAAAALPQFFYTSTEFRPDILWAGLWLLGLLIAVSGEFTVKRALGFGLILGLVFAVSLKTVVLAISLATATIIALALAWIHGARPRPVAGMARLAVIVAGLAVAPGLTVLYFKWRGAFGNMYYCVVSHNIVPGLKRWGHFSLHQWDFPIAVVAMAAYGWLILRQTPDKRLATRRAIIHLMPWLFVAFLLSYWPDITREDDLPYTPLVPLSAIPLLTLAGNLMRDEALKRKFCTYGLPAICFVELLFVWNLNPLRSDRVKVTTRSIHDVLLLTRPHEYVMDAKGDYVFRPRPIYWVIETLTRARMRLGLIQDRIPQALADTGTRICYLITEHIPPATSKFIVTNYMPFDPAAIDLGAAGKELGKPSADGTFSFDVAIPATYAVVSESGTASGTLDGAPYIGPVRLAAGHHVFHRGSGTGRAAIFLDRAAAAGFHPLFAVSEKLIAREQKRDE